MNKALRITGIVIVFLLLTVFTQIGGLVYLLSFLCFHFINNRVTHVISRFSLKLLSFLLLYTITALGIVPNVAPMFGRVALPLAQTNHLQPATWFTGMLNRNYVRTDLRKAAFQTAKAMNDQFPGTTINYLDAGFPFFDGFPLFPHLSHSDGKKLDISFCYMDAITGKPTNDIPSPIGYGISEEPRTGEINTAAICDQRGNWQYSLLSKWVSQKYKKDFVFDSVRTKALVNYWINNPAINKLFIEPHLKTRLGLKSNKIRFHGCQAVRHDDHIHVQL